MLLIAGVIAGAGITLFVKRQVLPTRPDAGLVQERHSDSPEREVTDAAAAIEDLERRLVELRKQQSEMAKQLASRSPGATMSSPAEPALSQEEADARYAEARETAISRVMEREGPDASAGARVADQITGTFAQTNLEGHLLSSVDCRTSVCRIDVQHGRGLDTSEALTAMQQALITGSEGTIEGFYRTIDHADGSSTTRLYVTNGVESLPDAAP